MKVAVIVLNWRGLEDTRECLQSLRRSTFPVDVIVVDNGSGDGSAEQLQAEFPQYEHLRQAANLGYAGGNNAGLDRALARGYDVVGVLNNDTIAAPGMVEAIVNELASHPDSAVSPTITVAGTGELWFIGARLHPETRLPVHDPQAHPGVTPYLTGCAIFASAATWRLVGGFREEYFLIFEDSEWSARATQRGVELRVADGALLEHKVSASINRSSGVGVYYWTRNGLHLRREWEGRRSTGAVWSLAVRPGLSAVKGEGMAGVRALALRLVAVLHAYVNHLGPARGPLLRALGVL